MKCTFLFCAFIIMEKKDAHQPLLINSTQSTPA